MSVRNQDNGDLERRISAFFSTRGLTPRQVEVMVLAVQGLSNESIATRLVIGERTVESHASAAMSRLGVPNRIAACFLLVTGGV